MRLTKNIIKKVIIILMILILNLPSLLTAATEVVIEDPTPDSTPPVLKSLSVSGTEISPDKSVKIIAEASDDLSGISSIYVSYRKPSGDGRSVSLYLNTATSKYEGTINVGTYDEPGDWKLNSITLTDKKENSRTIVDNSYASGSYEKMDMSPYTIKVTGVLEQTDKIPPALNSITISTQQAQPGDAVKVVADITDNESGVSGAYASFSKPSGRSGYAYLYYNQTTGKYEGSISIDQYDESGEWQLYYVSMWDKADNYGYVYNSASVPSTTVNKMDFSSCKFEVSGTKPDLLGPILDSLSISLEQVTNNGARVKLTAEGSDNLSGMNSLSADYRKPSGKSYYVSFGWNSTIGKYVAYIPIDKYDELGTWKLTSVHLYDYKDNSKYVYDSSQGYQYEENGDFSLFYFTVRGAITIPPPSPFSIGMSPKSITLEPGQSQQLKTILNMSDATTKDITLQSSGTVYTSSNPSAVKVDQNGLITVEPNATAGTTYIQAANSGLYQQIEVTIPGGTSKDFLRINPLKVNLASGQTKQLNVVASLADGTEKDITLGSTGTQYSSSDEALVSVDENGLIRVSADAKPGDVKIQVNHNGIVSEMTVTVTGPPVIKSLAMTPDGARVFKGETVQLSTRATMSDGSTKDVTAGSSGTIYKSSSASVATVDTNGLVTIAPEATKGASALITATNGGVSKSVTVIADEDPSKTVAELSVDSTSLTLVAGTTKQLKVIATMGDGKTKDVTLGSVGTKYTSNTTNVATVGTDGLISVLSEAPLNNRSTITVEYGGKKAYVTVTVGADPKDTLASIVPDQTTLTLSPGGTHQLAITATMGDGSTKDITSGSSGTTYTSSYTNVATVGTDGLISIPSNAPENYKSTITIEHEGKKAYVTVTVGAANPADILASIAPDQTALTLSPGKTHQLAITATMGDGSTKDVTLGSMGTKYTSSATSVATVGDDGLISIPSNAPENYKSTITIEHEGKKAYVTVTVGAANPADILASIAPDQTALTLSPGKTHQLAITATMGDGSTKDVTLGSTGTKYTSSATNVATVGIDGLISIPSNAPLNYKSTITVEQGGKKTYVTVTVGSNPADTLTSITANQTAVTLSPGKTHQLAITATMGDGSTKDVTLGSTGTKYTSSATNVATVGTDGLISIPSNAPLNYKSTITVEQGGKKTYVTVTVESNPADTLTSITVNQTAVTLSPGKTHQLAITATMGDGSTKDVTLGSTGTKYTSSATNVATVGTDGLISIPSNAPLNYKSTITVEQGGKKTYVTVTVGSNPADTLTSITANQTAVTLSPGKTHQLAITATMGDGSTKDVTLGSSGTTYTSSYTSVATVNANGLISVPSNAPKNYKTTITVKNGGKTAYVTVTIS